MQPVGTAGPTAGDGLGALGMAGGCGHPQPQPGPAGPCWIGAGRPFLPGLAKSRRWETEVVTPGGARGVLAELGQGNAGPCQPPQAGQPPCLLAPARCPLNSTSRMDE